MKGEKGIFQMKLLAKPPISELLNSIQEIVSDNFSVTFKYYLNKRFYNSNFDIENVRINLSIDTNEEKAIKYITDMFIRIGQELKEYEEGKEETTNLDTLKREIQKKLDYDITPLIDFGKIFKGTDFSAIGIDRLKLMLFNNDFDEVRFGRWLRGHLPNKNSVYIEAIIDKESRMINLYDLITKLLDIREKKTIDNPDIPDIPDIADHLKVLAKAQAATHDTDISFQNNLSRMEYYLDNIFTNDMKYIIRERSRPIIEPNYEPDDIWKEPLFSVIKSQRGGALETDETDEIDQREILTTYCDSILMILLLQMSNKHYDFLEKAQDTIREIGQEPFVYELLKTIIQKIPHTEKEFPQESYIFSEFPHVEGLRILEKAFHKKFTKSEISVLKGLSIPQVIYSRKPKEFEYALGTGAYSLEGSPEEGDITPMYGIEHDIDLTRDERALIEKGGIPVGALIFLYMVCLDKII